MPVLETLALTAAVASLRRGAHRAVHSAVAPRALASKAQRARIAENRAMRKVFRKLSVAARKRIGSNLRRLTLDEVKALNADAVNALFTNTAGGQPLGVILKNALSRARARDRATDLGTVFKTNGTQQQPWAVLFNTYGKLAKMNALPKKISSSSKSATKSGGKKSTGKASSGSTDQAAKNKRLKKMWGTGSLPGKVFWDSTMKLVTKKVKKILKKLPVIVKYKMANPNYAGNATTLNALLKNKARLYRTLAKQTVREQRKTLKAENLRPGNRYRSEFYKLQQACKHAGVKITKKGVKPA